MEAAAQATHTPFVLLDDSSAGSGEFGRWTKHLKHANRRGLERITVDVFKGRNGHRPLGELTLSTEAGEPIMQPGDVASFDAADTARDAYAVAARHNQREADTRYRICLWYRTKKNADATRSDNCCALKFDDDGEPEFGGEAMTLGGIPVAMYKALSAENKDLRGFVNALLSGQVQMSQVNTATMLNGLELLQVAATVRAETAEEAAKIKHRATPAEVTKRVKTVFDGVGDTLSRLARYLPPPGAVPHGQPAPGAPAGSPGPTPGPTPGASKAQANARAPENRTRSAMQTEMVAVFETFTPAQNDALRDQLPKGMHADLIGTLHGDPAEFEAARETMGEMLQAYQATLVKCLSVPQLLRMQAATKL